LLFSASASCYSNIRRNVYRDGGASTSLDTYLLEIIDLKPMVSLNFQAFGIKKVEKFVASSLVEILVLLNSIYKMSSFELW